MKSATYRYQKDKWNQLGGKGEKYNQDNCWDSIFYIDEPKNAHTYKNKLNSTMRTLLFKNKIKKIKLKKIKDPSFGEL